MALSDMFKGVGAFVNRLIAPSMINKLTTVEEGGVALSKFISEVGGNAKKAEGVFGSLEDIFLKPKFAAGFGKQLKAGSRLAGQSSFLAEAMGFPSKSGVDDIYPFLKGNGKLQGPSQAFMGGISNAFRKDLPNTLTAMGVNAGIAAGLGAGMGAIGNIGDPEEIPGAMVRGAIGGALGSIPWSVGSMGMHGLMQQYARFTPMKIQKSMPFSIAANSINLMRSGDKFGAWEEARQSKGIFNSAWNKTRDVLEETSNTAKRNIENAQKHVR